MILLDFLIFTGLSEEPVKTVLATSHQEEVMMAMVVMMVAMVVVMLVVRMVNR